jgi:hypothetical protein
VTFHRLPYVSRQLHAALLTVPVADPPDPASGFPPAVLWSRLEGEEEPVAVWLLTPALLAAVRRDADRRDAQALAGKIPADEAEVIAARYDRVMRYARDAAAAGWWYCGAAKDMPPPKKPPRPNPWDFEDAAGKLAAAERLAAHNADAVERWLKKAHKRPRNAAKGADSSGARSRGPKRPGGRREASPDLFTQGEGA